MTPSCTYSHAAPNSVWTRVEGDDQDGDEQQHRDHCETRRCWADPLLRREEDAFRGATTVDARREGCDTGDNRHSTVSRWGAPGRKATSTTTAHSGSATTPTQGPAKSLRCPAGTKPNTAGSVTRMGKAWSSWAGVPPGRMRRGVGLSQPCPHLRGDPEEERQS